MVNPSRIREAALGLTIPGLLYGLYNDYSRMNRWNNQFSSAVSFPGKVYTGVRSLDRMLRGRSLQPYRGVRASGYTKQGTKPIGKDASKQLTAPVRKRGRGRVMGRRRYRRAKKRIRPQGSFVFSLERGGSIQPTVAGIIGHYTSPRIQMQRCMFAAILRRLFGRAGYRCSMPARPIDGIVTGDTVILHYEFGAASLDDWSFSLTAGATLSQAITAMANSFNTELAALAGNLALGNLRIYRATLFPATTGPNVGRIELDLTNAKFQFNITSTLNIQNRSVGETGDEEMDEVDNTPVHGRCYEGLGSGPDSRYSTDATSLTIIHADTTNGVILANNPENMEQAPMTYNFVNIKRTGYTKIHPGTIHTSKLTLNRTYDIGTLCRMLFIATADGNYAARNGKYRLFHLEKVLETNNTNPLAMNLAYQHGLRISVKLLNPNTDVPIPEFVRS